ncbi:MAG: quinolinate synthase NadA [Candidatus Thermoplasmatota archaeon]|nr:quinolinate synthase NadA [Candidatus Thermoplasmatota archaeon]
MEIAERIKELKKQKDAILLVHNYQIPEIQELGDFIGDSLGLAQAASKTKAKVIVFCGVDFMAESAKILNPDKIVVHPEPKAKCPMAAMVNIEKLKKLKAEHPEAQVVSYVNTTAETKALSDFCCTSANAVKVVKSLQAKEIIFLPDKHLAEWVSKQVPDKNIIPWEGYCWVHQDLIKKPIIEMIKKEHPKAEVLAHPECVAEVRDIADFVLSTEGMVKHVAKSDKKEFIIGTEKELCYRLKKENPHKIFYPVKNAICREMKMITLEKVLRSLENLEPRIELLKETIEKARKPLEKMIEIGRED